MPSYTTTRKFACYPLSLRFVSSKSLWEPLILMKSKLTKLVFKFGFGLISDVACALVLPLTLVFSHSHAHAQGHAPTTEIHGIAATNIDTSVQPGDDFFQ